MVEYFAWQYDDGGRRAAGYKGSTRDCVTRSIAIASGLSYAEVYYSVNQLAKDGKKERYGNARTGVSQIAYVPLIKSLGFIEQTVESGSAIKIGDIPSEGTFIVHIQRHLTVVCNGVIHDTFNPSKDGTAKIIHLWKKEGKTPIARADMGGVLDY